MQLNDEVKFCIRFLLSKGLDLQTLSFNLSDLKGPDYSLVKKQHSFNMELAEKLRNMWPAGEKEGGYSWRDSVDNLTRRLDTLWRVRNLGDIPMERCLSVAQRYLQSFENRNTKYMQTLKYFIFKQKDIPDGKGKIKYIYESKFADMLEGKADEDAIQNEWENLINSSSGEGVLV